MRPERDACGIGFVADAEGRSSRAIVEAALSGLACVTHRGALAADARTADGSGLLLPIPRSIFGTGPGDSPHGVAALFVRGDDPRTALEEAAQTSVEVRVGDQRLARAKLTFVMKAIESERVHEQRRYVYGLWPRDLKPPITIL